MAETALMRPSGPPLEKVVVVLVLAAILVLLVIFKGSTLEKSVTSPVSTVVNSSLAVQSSSGAISQILNNTYKQSAFSVYYTGYLGLNVSGSEYNVPFRLDVFKENPYYRMNYSLNFSSINGAASFSNFPNSSEGFIFDNSTGYTSCTENVSSRYVCEYYPTAVQQNASFGAIIYFFTVNPYVSNIMSESPYNFLDLLSPSYGLILKSTGSETLNGNNCTLDSVYENTSYVKSIGELCVSPVIGLPLSADVTFAGTGTVRSLSIDFTALFYSSIPNINISYVPINSSVSIE